MKITSSAKKAIIIGGMCSLSYLAVYIARNILSTVSPQIIKEGKLSTESIGTLSSVYFIAYAMGQLINGMIGDRLKAKYMISFGLILAGICNFLFSLLSNSAAVAYAVYGMTGFFLSMIYAPMTKTVSENTEPIYAERCSLGYTFASLFGSPLAGVLAAFFAWRNVFASSSIILLVMGFICFIFFTVFEKKKFIEYNKYKRQKGKNGGIKLLIKHQIIKFTLVSILTGIVRTTVVFWLPTYLSDYLGFSSKNSALIFTIATLVISMSTFVAFFLYERLGRNMSLTVLVSFIASALSFLIVFIFKVPTLNIIFMVFAILFSDCAATILWSMYCPSLRDTGMVSSATGFLDFVSYMAASASSTLFANAVAVIGWKGLIFVWFLLMLSGIAVTIPYYRFKKIA